MAKTVIGLYDEFSEARQTVNDLVDAGFGRDQISMVASDKEGTYSKAVDTEKFGKDRDTGTDAGDAAASGAVAGGILGGLAGVLLGLGVLAIPGVGPAIAAGPIISGLVGAGVGAAGGGLLGALVGMGVPKEEAGYYAEGVRRGGVIVAVNTPESQVDSVIGIMNRHNPVDIEQRVAQWQGEGWKGYDADAKPYTATAAHTESGYHRSTGDRDTETRIPVMEEELRVGKRAVERGGVRVHTFVESEPVEKEVRLRQEHVDVERRRVDRPISEGDLKAFEEATFEVSETAEEAVVDKKARVVEEVVIKKDVEEHPETVRDTVRHTRVDVDRMGERHHAADLGDFDSHRTYFQQHFNTHFGSTGGVYSDYEPAYRFGHGLSSYRGRRWEEIEPEVRRRWESENKGPWEKFKDAVRYGWSRL